MLQYQCALAAGCDVIPVANELLRADCIKWRLKFELTEKKQLKIL